VAGVVATYSYRKCSTIDFWFMEIILF
jgi:hypothetical protein